MSSALAKGSTAPAPAGPSDSKPIATVAPVPTFDTPLSKGISFGRVVILLGLLYVRFSSLVEDPVSTLQIALPLLAAVQVVYAVQCLPATGSQQAKTVKKARPGEKKKDETHKAGTVVIALLALIASIMLSPAIHILFVLFGAPFLDNIYSTFLCAAHFSILGVFPIIYTRGIDNQALVAVAGASAPLDEPFGALLGAVLGAWLGAIPIPLDWDREWQKWPVTIMCGLYAGSCLASWVSGAVFYGKKLGGDVISQEEEE